MVKITRTVRVGPWLAMAKKQGQEGDWMEAQG